MKKSGRQDVAAAILVTALGLLAVPGFGQEPEWHQAQDRQGRFSLRVPATWLVDQTRADRALAARSPEPPGTSPNTIDVWVHDAPFPLSAEACARQVASVMRVTIHHWTTLEEGPSQLGGLPAFSRSYLWRLGNEERRSLQFCVTVGRRAFVLVGTTANTPARVARDLPDIVRSMETFRPGPPAPPTTSVAGPKS